MRVPFNEGFANNMENFMSLMGDKELQADVHSVLMNIGAVDAFEPEEESAIKCVLQMSMELYHVCNRDPEKYKTLIKFLNPEAKV